MPPGFFTHENDLLKHHVRIDGWLPSCRRRLHAIRESAGRRSNPRRLRYFTFCAVGAIDVLMLDVAKVIRRSGSGRFDSVFFFDRRNEYVIETRRRIPGAIGFPGSFVDLVLRDDPEGDAVLDSNAPLLPPQEEEDVHQVRVGQLERSIRRDFISAFPFDVINLDLEEFFLVPGAQFPGKMIRALRKVFEWQRRFLTTPQRNNEPLTGFSLMFTTQIGPPNLTDQYLNMLNQRLTDNVGQFPDLIDALRNRTGVGDINRLQATQFEMFFKLGVPKVLTAILKEEDWYVDSTQGIRTYEFERPWRDGTYKMLHFVIDVLRQNPPRERRAPGILSTPDAEAAYEVVVRRLIAEPEQLVTLETINQQSLQKSLDHIKARRRKYCPECPE